MNLPEGSESKIVDQKIYRIPLHLNDIKKNLYPIIYLIICIDFDQIE